MYYKGVLCTIGFNEEKDIYQQSAQNIDIEFILHCAQTKTRSKLVQNSVVTDIYTVHHTLIFIFDGEHLWIFFLL